MGSFGQLSLQPQKAKPPSVGLAGESSPKITKGIQFFLVVSHIFVSSNQDASHHQDYDIFSMKSL